MGEDRSAGEDRQAEVSTMSVVIAVCMPRGLAEQALAALKLTVATFKVNAKVRDKVAFDISTQSAAELARSLVFNAET
eukprot:5489094-Amphidinium_carterae.1